MSRSKDNNLFMQDDVTLQECVDRLAEWHAELDGRDPVPQVVKYASVRRIACAANRYGGYIVTGARHHDPMMQMQMLAIGYQKLWDFAGGRDKEEQGFVDQWGYFLTREEAWDVAEAAGQIIHPDVSGPDRYLFSEHYL